MSSQFNWSQTVADLEKRCQQLARDLECANTRIGVLTGERREYLRALLRSAPLEAFELNFDDTIELMRDEQPLEELIADIQSQGA